MILTQGLADAIEDVSNDMTNGQAGTDTTLFVKSQTGLITEVGATDIALTDQTFTSTSISVTHLLNVSTGNGNTLTEFETNNTTISYNRSVKAGVIKTSSIELTTLHTFTFEAII